jgi:hypothetical protein
VERTESCKDERFRGMKVSGMKKIEMEVGWMEGRIDRKYVREMKFDWDGKPSVWKWDDNGK